MIALTRRTRRRTRSSITGARVLDPVAGIDAHVDVRVDDGVIAAIGTSLERNAHRVDRRARPRARAGVRRSARASAHAGARGRGDDRLRHRGRRGGRLLRDPRDAEHGSRRRLGRGARVAHRSGQRSDADDPGRLPRRDHEGPARRRADRDGRARGRGRRRLHRRRAPGALARADAPRAPVRVDHGPASCAARGGAVALARRTDARGRGLRRARLRRLSLGRGVADGRARPRARGVREPAAAPHAPLGEGVGRGARAGGGHVRPPRSRLTTSASRTRRCARSTRT